MAVKKLQIKINYTCSDGKVFDNENDAQTYERMLYVMEVAAYFNISGPAAKYLASRDEVEDEAPLRVKGYWSVRTPHRFADVYRRTAKKIGVVRGTYLEAIEWAMEQPGFVRENLLGDVVPFDIIELS